MSDVEYVDTPIVPPGPYVMHAVGVKPLPPCVNLTGYCAVVPLGVIEDIISGTPTEFEAACIGKDVPIFENPSPYPDLD